MRKIAFIKSSGLALILWALHLLVKDFIFAFTHGTTETAMDITFLGLNRSQYSVLWTPFALLGVAGLAGVYAEVSPRIGKTGKAGFLVAIVGLALSFVAAVMQFWILDVDKYFHSPLVLGGWFLSLLSVFISTVGLIFAGRDIGRTNALPRGRFLVLIIGLLTLPTFFFVSYVVMNSNDTLPWKLLYGSLSVPSDLCWAWLGYVLIAASRNPSPILSRTPQ